MGATLTIRADEALRKALSDRAESEGKTVSALIREILEEAVSPKSWDLRVGHLKGRLEVREAGLDGWRKQLRDRNWRP